MNTMIPMVVLLSASKDRRRDMADALVPSLVPGPPATRVAVSAVMADTAVRRQEHRSAQVVEQAVTAATTPGLDAAALNGFTSIAPVLKRRPDLRDRLVEISAADARLGDAVVHLATVLAEKPATFDLNGEEAKPLKDRLSLEQRDQLEAVIHDMTPKTLSQTSRAPKPKQAARKQAARKQAAPKQAAPKQAAPKQAALQAGGQPANQG